MATRIAPRVKRATAGVNQAILDQAVRHAVYLERYKRKVASDVARTIRQEVLPDSLRRFRAAPADSWSRSRLADEVASLNQTLRTAMAVVGESTRDELGNLAVSESEWQAATIGKVSPFELSLVTPDPGYLKVVVADAPMEGQLVGDWFDTLARDTADYLAKQVRVGLAAGKSVPDVVRALRGEDPDAFGDAFGSGARASRQAEAVVRTAANNASTLAREESYKANSDVISGVMMVATLDSRTTLFCAGIDGQVFPVDEGPRPPFHWNCRTVTAPVTKSWKELGLGGSDSTPSERASMDGTVPAKQTYDSWLRKQGKDFQDEVLGPGRATLFRAGLAIDRFTDASGHEYTLQELRGKLGLK